MMPWRVHPHPFRFTLHVMLEVMFTVGLLVALGWGLIDLLGRTNRVMDLMAVLSGPVLTVTAGALVLAAVLRLRNACIVGALALVALTLAVWPQWNPGGPKPAEGAPVMRVYSANLYFRNADAQAIRASIADARADTVVLVEVSAAVAAQADAVLAGYPHRAASVPLDQVTGEMSANVIASRWPLTPIETPPDGLNAYAAVAQTPLGAMTVVATHLTRPWPFQDSYGQISQVEALTARMKTAPRPIVAAGDFNTVSSARIGRQLRRDIGLHPAPAGLGTWPTDLPAPLSVTIDHVWASEGLAFRSRRLGKPVGSDHRPVVVEITRAR